MEASCEYVNELSGSTKGGNFLQAKRLQAAGEISLLQ
jgi:hypothetical protein